MIKKINIENLICIGSIGKPKGLSGEFFLNSYSYPKENILNYSNFIFENDAPEFFSKISLLVFKALKRPVATLPQPQIPIFIFFIY